MRIVFDNAGDINVSIPNVMTNEQMAQAILNEFTTHFHSNIIERTREVKKYIKTLRANPDGVFLDPCYELGGEIFICSFEFDN